MAAVARRLLLVVVAACVAFGAWRWWSDRSGVDAVPPAVQPAAPGTEQAARDGDRSAASRLFTGRVVDEIGRPIAGATVRQVREVTLFGARTGNVGPTGDAVTTDADGRFSLPRAEFLWVYASAEAPGRKPGRSIALHIGQDQPLEVVLAPAPSSGK